MRSRLASSIGDEKAAGVHVGTFHSIASSMLRGLIYKLNMDNNLSKNFTILDDYGQKQVIADLSIKLGLLDSKKNKITISKYHNQIMSWKENGMTVQNVKEADNLFAITNTPLLDEPQLLINAVKIYSVYQAELENRNWCDFPDLILHMVKIFRRFPEIKQLVASRYRYIHVDEYQDTSPMQDEFITHLADSHSNLCCIGDIDQCIYMWRQSNTDIMLNFPKKWRDCNQVTIDTNYRSIQEILDIANTVIEPLRTKDGLDKLLRSSKSGTHPVDFFKVHDDAYDEAHYIASKAAEMISKGTKPCQIAILCRSGMIIRFIETALRKAQLKYVVAGAQKFSDREEIKDAIAWLTLAIKPDDYIAFERAITKPKRGFGPQKIKEIRDLVISSQISIRDAAEQLSQNYKPSTRSHKDYVALVELLDILQSIVINGSTCGEILSNILEETGYMQMRRLDEKDEQVDFRLENLDLLISEARDYMTPHGFLEDLSLQASTDRTWDGTSIILATVHASKGLEFDNVFCPAMEEGVFPNAKSEKTPYGPDEERRLAHVAWTRARKELHVSYAEFRPGGGSGLPSKYLAESGFLTKQKTTFQPADAPKIIRARRF